MPVRVNLIQIFNTNIHTLPLYQRHYKEITLIYVLKIVKDVKLLHKYLFFIIILEYEPQKHAINYILFTDCF